MPVSLYRKYRPRTFEDVVGQEHITDTLKNQIMLGRVGHAYLFTGSRGTGKTTCAKILARAVSCLSPQNGSPCGNCQVCVTNETGLGVDIVEMDAASNNGVDEARDLRDKVKYLPAYSKYKVYIIDEVHMLSGGAFNALLKTLEEPPPHVVFILATTEPHKLPATILSRCMRFDFHLVSIDTLAVLIKKIYDLENKPYRADAIRMIASLADGSVRDALSVADMCLNYSDTLTLDDVLTLTGASDRTRIFDLFNALYLADTAQCFLLIDTLCKGGKSIGMIARDIVMLCRDLLLVKTVGAKKAAELSLIIESEEKIALLERISTECDTTFLQKTLIDFSALDSKIRYSVSPRIVLETAVVASIASRQALVQQAPPIQPSSVTAKPQEPPIDRSAPPPPARQAIEPEPVPLTLTEAEKQERFEKIDNALPLLGRVVTIVRRTNPEIFAYLKSGADLEVTDSAAILYAMDANFLRLTEEDSVAVISEALKALNITVPLVVKKRSAPDMDKIVERVQALFGKDNANIS